MFGRYVRSEGGLTYLHWNQWQAFYDFVEAIVDCGISSYTAELTFAVILG